MSPRDPRSFIDEDLRTLKERLLGNDEGETISTQQEDDQNFITVKRKDKKTKIVDASPRVTGGQVSKKN